MTVRKVDVRANADRLFRLFEANEQHSEHARAVVADGEADLWLAEDDGRLAGALLGRRMRSSDGEVRGGVDNLLVDARYRRRGIGRRLMEEAEAYYREQGLRGMELAVGVENAAARPLYDSMGYDMVRRYTRRRYDAEGIEVVQQRLRMRKQFPSSAPR